LSELQAKKILEAVQNDSVDVVALSALLTTTMPRIKATIEVLDTAGVRDQIKVIIGGAPVTTDYADQIGADGYSPDASAAVRVVNTLLGV
jgi:5-methyltetrahydrofolate--homocysteine methyltransferase